MDLKTWLSEKRGRQAFLARAIGAHAPDISRWADGTRPIPIDYGSPIEIATDRIVTRMEMFPDTWQKIWPELADKQPLAGRRASDRRKRVCEPPDAK